MFAQTLKEKSSFGMMGIAVVVGLYVLLGAFIVAVTITGRANFENSKGQQRSQQSAPVACVPQQSAAC